ncbi:hypothetical protein HHK36_031022 [Tetracentron sinense]|uniref:Interferon-related developmental regulator 1 n=1 Tax=Tetracentron sinense TaxID=13715 RepID=A0A834YAU3_TETSI|nr:hypothetical protein HHK36_031022 [Tetracentron sinense]
MGKRSNKRRSASLFDSDDDSLSSSSTAMSDLMLVPETEDVQHSTSTPLDQNLDALFEKRGSTREKGLSSIVEAFTNNMQHSFVEKKYLWLYLTNEQRGAIAEDGLAELASHISVVESCSFVTLLHQCLNSIKRGSSKEISLASHAIGLLAVTVGCRDHAREILEESAPSLVQALKFGSETSKISSILDCLAIINFVGGNDPEDTETAMQIIWQFIYPKSGSNVIASKPSAAVITAAISAWSFLLTTMDGWRLNSKKWQESISYFSSLLDKDDRSVRIAVGEVLALIFEVGSLEKFSGEAKGSSDSSVHEGTNSREEYVHIQGLKGKILGQVRNLSAEAGGKGSAKKDLNSQRNLFRDVLEFLELNFLKRFLGGGFIKHMLENEFLHDVFMFTPNRKNLSGNEQDISSSEKRMYKSPNSFLNKARTQLLNKQRTLAQGKNNGHYAMGVGSDEA